MCNRGWDEWKGLDDRPKRQNVALSQNKVETISADEYSLELGGEGPLENDWDQADSDESLEHFHVLQEPISLHRINKCEIEL